MKVAVVGPQNLAALQEGHLAKCSTPFGIVFIFWIIFSLQMFNACSVGFGNFLFRPLKFGFWKLEFSPDPSLFPKNSLHMPNFCGTF